MTVDRRTVAWAKTYRETLRNLFDSLGGEENVAPAKLAIARTLAVLQTELSVLTDRFAADGRGGSPDDINRFLKISDTVASLLAALGLGKPLQQSGQNHAENAHAALQAVLEGIMRVRADEEAKGIFRDRAGSVIDNRGHVEGCECEPCCWRRSTARDANANNAAVPHHEPLAVANPAPSALSVVAGTAWSGQAKS
jgi:hypothetical protein